MQSCALIGMAAFMGGSGKILMFLAIVLLEITNDMNMLPPLCLALLIALWVGKNFNHGLYHELIHIQGWPYLDAKFDGSGGLDEKTVADVMLKDLAVFNEHQTCQEAWDILCTKYDDDDDGSLTADEMARCGAGRNFTITDDDGYFRGIVTIHDLRAEAKNDMTNGNKPLSSIMRTTLISARTHWNLHYGYCIFQKLGLRNMPVVDEHNRPVGMVTRLTLMPWWTQIGHDKERLGKDSGGFDYSPRKKKKGTVVVHTDAISAEPEPRSSEPRAVATI